MERQSYQVVPMEQVIIEVENYDYKIDVKINNYLPLAIAYIMREGIQISNEKLNCEDMHIDVSSNEVVLNYIQIVVLSVLVINLQRKQELSINFVEVN